jgi:hypothetical protein
LESAAAAYSNYPMTGEFSNLSIENASEN